MNYATVADIESRITNELSDEQKTICESLIEDASILIDAYNSKASDDAKKVVCCRMVIRAIGSLDAGAFPVGASHGSVSALGYSQSWTVSSGAVGELYLSKTDKKYLGVGNRIGFISHLFGGSND